MNLGWQLVTASLRNGERLFSAAILALGAETVICARFDGDSLGPPYHVIPVLPWLPALPWLGYIFGTLLILCGAALLFKYHSTAAAVALAFLLTLCALTLDLPRYSLDPENISKRTTVFEPLALASIACLLPGVRPLPQWLERTSRCLFCLALLVFGIDHFLGIRGIPNLIPSWIPWRAFWVFLTGLIFVAGAVSIFKRNLLSWGMFLIGSMFAVWVLVLHLPNCIGLNGIAGAPKDPNQWESLFIAIALWGGGWALAAQPPEGSASISLES